MIIFWIVSFITTCSPGLNPILVVWSTREIGDSSCTVSIKVSRTSASVNLRIIQKALLFISYYIYIIPFCIKNFKYVWGNRRSHIIVSKRRLVLRERCRKGAPHIIDPFPPFSHIIHLFNSFGLFFHSLRPCDTASFPRFFRVLDGNLISFLSP